jgi:hypothetical protein
LIGCMLADVIWPNYLVFIFAAVVWLCFSHHLCVCFFTEADLYLFTLAVGSV